MDHEFDRTQSPGTDQTDAGETKDGTAGPDAGAPSAAQFKEAARLAAARARKAIHQQRRDDAREDAAPLATEASGGDFERAARTRSMHLSGRDSSAPTDTGPDGTSAKAGKTGKVAGAAKGAKADKTVSQLDRRLMLGARMLRAFESQIDRLKQASTAGREPGAPASTLTTAEFERLEGLLERAAEVEARLHERTQAAELALESLTRLVERAAARMDDDHGRSAEVQELDSRLQGRVSELRDQSHGLVESMNDTLRRVMEIERAVTTRVNQAMARLERPQAPAEPAPQVPARGGEAPLIEVEPLERAEATEPPAPAESGPTSAISAGTLSVDPARLERRRQGAS
ncbi:MAG: hypothetical protein VXX30_08015 [Planctomycetota bacterium]|nr:hypothetical protein [Planctomycetota bacterium]